jgi:hypothetical protein
LAPLLRDLSLNAGQNISILAAKTDLGRIAGQGPQRGAYASLWVGLGF